jgi:hypothetical protein
MTANETKLVAMIKRFLQEGDYNDEGDYVFASDTVETGPLSEPDTMVPGVVLDACELLRELSDAAVIAR